MLLQPADQFDAFPAVRAIGITEQQLPVVAHQVDHLRAFRQPCDGKDQGHDPVGEIGSLGHNRLSGLSLRDGLLQCHVVHHEEHLDLVRGVVEQRTHPQVSPFGDLLDGHVIEGVVLKQGTRRLED